MRAPSVFNFYRPGYVAPGSQAAAAGLRVRDTLSFGPDYGRTCALWRERFLAALPQVRALGFDERFIRTWEFYLAYCEAGFVQGDICDAEAVRAAARGCRRNDARSWRFPAGS